MRVLTLKPDNGRRGRMKPPMWCRAGDRVTVRNQRVIVFDPVCGFDNTELLVSEVTFTQDQNGTLTEIRVGPPDAYLPEPEDPGARKKKKARVQEDPF